MKMRRWSWTLLWWPALSTVGCGLTGGYNLPPAVQLAEPGPGVGGPGPGVLPPPMPPISPTAASAAIESMGDGSVAYGGEMAYDGGVNYGGEQYGGSYCAQDTVAACPPGATISQEVQVLFGRPEAMQVQWDTSGSGQFDSSPLVTPGRQNFTQGGVFRLKLTSIPGAGREGVELYPTLEIGPPSYRSLAFLAHNAIPIQFTEEDFDQVLAGNFVTKVIYLPDPEFQDWPLPT